MSLTLEKTWVVRVAATRPVLGVLVTFARSQTLITGAELNFDGKLDLEVRGLSVLRRWSPERTTEADQRLHLRLWFRGEPPRIASFTYAVQAPHLHTKSDLVLPSWVLQADAFSEPRCAALWKHDVLRHTVLTDVVTLAQLESLSPPPEDDLRTRMLEVFAWRREAIADRAAAETFFLQLDLATTPALIDAELRTAIGELGYHLAARVRDRRATAQTNHVPVFARIDSDDLFGERAQLEEVSRLMRRLIEDHLSSRRPDLLEWAFEMFATDLLQVAHDRRVPHGLLQAHGAPNGIFYFQFAELGLFCIENEVDATFWRKHLPAFVRTAHVFAENAPERSVPQGASPYPIAEENYAYVPGRWYPRRRLEDLRARYANGLRGRFPVQAQRYLEDRLTWIVGHALPPAVPSSFVVKRSLTPDPKCDQLWLGGIDPAWSALVP